MHPLPSSNLDSPTPTRPSPFPSTILQLCCLHFAILFLFEGFVNVFPLIKEFHNRFTILHFKPWSKHWFKRYSSFMCFTKIDLGGIVDFNELACDLTSNFLYFWQSSELGKAGGYEPPSPSAPHFSFFLFRHQPWATTISPSVPPHLTLPGKTTF